MTSYPYPFWQLRWVNSDVSEEFATEHEAKVRQAFLGRRGILAAIGKVQYA